MSSAPKLVSLFAATLLCLAATGCTSGRSQSPQALNLVSGLPDLSDLRRQISTPADWSQTGSEYDDALPHFNVTRAGSSAIYTTGPNPEDLSFAIYRFDLAGLTGQQDLELNWSAAPPLDTLYVGLADWNSERWEFFRLFDPASLSIADITRFIRNDDSALLVVIPTAPGSCTLDACYFPGPPVAPTIDAVTPLLAHPSETVDFQASTTGSPHTYTWNFGGGCTPNTPNDPAPQVVAGASGEYNCHLEVSNDLGTAGLDFTLRVVEPLNGWVHTFGSFGGTAYFAQSDVSGNLYIAGNPWFIVKYSPDGTREWERRWDFPEYTDDVTGFAIDTDGSYYMSGSYAYDYPDGEGVIVARFDNTGTLQWARRWQGPDYQYRPTTAGSLALDGNGVHVAATFDLMDNGLNDAALITFDRDGNLLRESAWTADDTFAYGHYCAADGAGNVYLAGRVNIGVSSVPGLLMKYDSLGALQWVKYLGGGTQAANIHCLADGSPMLATKWGGSAALMHFNSDGSLQWAAKYLHNASSHFNDFFIAPGGDIYMTGTYHDDLLFSNNEIHLMHATAGGTFDWCHAWLGNAEEHEYMMSVCPAPGGGIYLSGTAFSVSGGWIDHSANTTWSFVTPTITSPSGTSYDPDGLLEDLTGSAQEMSWNGIVEDTGSGNSDVLVMRYLP